MGIAGLEGFGGFLPVLEGFIFGSLLSVYLCLAFRPVIIDSRVQPFPYDIKLILGHGSCSRFLVRIAYRYRTALFCP